MPVNHILLVSLQSFTLLQEKVQALKDQGQGATKE